MGVGKALAFAIGIVAAVVIFLGTYGWFASHIGFGVWGFLLGLLIAAGLGYLAYLIIMKLYGAAKS